MKKILLSLLLLAAIPAISQSKKPFIWGSANLYFIVTDRFQNGDKTNDVNFNRTKTPGKLRGFEGGDLKGITQKIDEGYFDKLGTNAIWTTPVVEQIHGATNEGTGVSYGFHGYWAKDWTRLDPNFGTEDDLMRFVETAHKHGIRVMLDGVINHTGPGVPMTDPVWPFDWVRTGPQCDYKTFETTTACTLVANLPDILTESDAPVNLPDDLLQKWKKEGRYDQEIAELNDFFKRTGYPRAPKYFIIKWLTDYIRKYGVDGYRADTVKHTNEQVWVAFKEQCDFAFAQWKQNNPSKVLDNNPFYTLAEVYNYGISGGQDFDFGDKKVNYFKNGFNAMINFEFKWDAQKSYESIFSKYSNKLHKELKDYSVLNYLSSHDDGAPFDKMREKGIEAGTKLLLSPGISQTYYGDETNRPLAVEGAQGDANLRSLMNWDDIANRAETKQTLEHWQKLGQFRRDHPAVGAGIHVMLSEKPYVFTRILKTDKIDDTVVIGLDLPKGEKEIVIDGIFPDGTQVLDRYSGKKAKVKKGFVKLDTDFNIALLEILEK